LLIGVPPNTGGGAAGEQKTQLLITIEHKPPVVVMRHQANMSPGGAYVQRIVLLVCRTEQLGYAAPVSSSVEGNNEQLSLTSKRDS
jgi:hypothetical protein